jgi:hypothetical protein
MQRGPQIQFSTTEEPQAPRERSRGHDILDALSVVLDIKDNGYKPTEKERDFLNKVYVRVTKHQRGLNISDSDILDAIHKRSREKFEKREMAVGPASPEDFE